MKFQKQKAAKEKKRMATKAVPPDMPGGWAQILNRNERSNPTMMKHIVAVFAMIGEAAALNDRVL